jgi:putative ABC transport system substrate-binding protein
VIARIAALLCALALSCAASAQSGRVYRIGMLEIESARANRANMEALLRGLKEAGYTEGKDFLIDYRSADGRPDRFADLAAELARAKPDIVITRGSPAALAARAATSAPIVMASSGDPVQAGIVKSLAHPGGNVTGMTNFVLDLAAKRVDILRELLPPGSSFGVTFNFGNPVDSAHHRVIDKAARSAGLQLVVFDVRDAQSLDRALKMSVERRLGALILNLEGATLSRRDAIVDFATKHKLPVLFSARDGVDAGGLMSYGPDYPHLYYRVASYVDRIFRGAKPSDLPIEQPTKFNLVISIKAAKAIGLTIPRGLLLRADEVIE